MIIAPLLAVLALPCLAEPSFEQIAAAGAQAAVRQAKSSPMLSWDYPGGEGPYQERWWMTRSGAYHYERAPSGMMQGRGTPASCAAPAPAGDAELRRALADADVAAAFAKKNVLFGWDTRCHDGHAIRVDVMGAVIVVGGECPRHGERMSCQDVCVDAPKGVAALVLTLRSLEASMTSSVPACRAARSF